MCLDRDSERRGWGSDVLGHVAGAMDLADPIRCRNANHRNLTLGAIAKRGGLETLILQGRF